jgi:hypothetical protein
MTKPENRQTSSTEKMRSLGDSEKVADQKRDNDDEAKLRSTGDARKVVPQKDV